MDSRLQQIVRLYRLMPGAPPIPTQDGRAMWGDVEGNDHWNFCAEIVDLIISAAS